VTLHRPAVVDDEAELLRVMETLERIAAERPLLFPVHPRTAANLERAGWAAGSVRLLEPQGYLRFLSLQASAFAVLTDSGGVQEETTALGVRCFTLRANTERPITIDEGTNRLLGVGPSALADFRDALASLDGARPSVPEGWDGHAAERAAAVIVERLGG
jgi:UDP-N-acetylglucosamine 2-epimerase (non-hydrolysing)